MMIFKHTAAILLLLLSQFGAGAAVMCDEDSGFRALEWLATSCCFSTGGDADADLDGAPALSPEEECGGCSDTALGSNALLTGRDDDSLDRQAPLAQVFVDSSIHSLPMAARVPTTHCNVVIPIVLQAARTTVLRR